MSEDKPRAAEEVDRLLATPDLAEALESHQFKQFLDHLPVAILVGEIGRGAERIVYANLEALERLGLPEDQVVGKGWSDLDRRWTSRDGGRGFSETIAEGETAIGVFKPAEGEPGVVLETAAAVIEGEDGQPRFRIVALLEASGDDATAKLREKDMLLEEIQHRVKNNLQMITALIRMEARKAGGREDDPRFDRLAGRVETLGLLYQQLSGGQREVDLGSYLSQIASAVMKAQAVEGIRLNHQVDVIPASINVAMPLGLLVNELVTNALKYAFEGRDEGQVTLRCVRDEDGFCLVSVADDGVGMGEGEKWPRAGKLGYLIARSIKENTGANVEARSEAGKGVVASVRLRLP